MHGDSNASTSHHLQRLGGEYMQLQLSSGQGPEECELAVGKLLRALREEFPDIEVLDSILGKKPECYRLVRIQSQTDLSFLEGTIKWVCQSPFRSNQKRKNWFVDISLYAVTEQPDCNESLVRFETFYSHNDKRQKGKVETGIRAIHMPTGIVVTSAEGRNQHMNRKLALNRLCELLAIQGQQDADMIKSLNQLERTRLEEERPKRIYEGLSFKRQL